MPAVAPSQLRQPDGDADVAEKLVGSIRAAGLCQSVHENTAYLPYFLGLESDVVNWVSAGMKHMDFCLCFEH